MLVLPVGFSVVTDDPVGIGHWGSLGVGGGNFSVESVVQSLEQTVSQVHISDHVDAVWEGNRSWQLSVSVSPVVLDTLHVPLVDEDNDFLLWAFINFLEKLIISLVNENALEFGEEDSKGLNVPVH